MLMTGPASAGVALIAGATLAGAWLARRASGMRAASLACAAGALLVVVLADLLPDIWRDLPGAGLPWWAAACALAAGAAGTDVLARRGCACRTGPDPGGAGRSGPDRGGVDRGGGACDGEARGGPTATALGLHRALEGAALVVTGSVAVIAALIAHAASEGFAMAALLSGERRGKAVALLAVTCVSPAAGAIAASQVRLPAQAAPMVTALIAGVLLRAAMAARRRPWLPHRRPWRSGRRAIPARCPAAPGRVSAHAAVSGPELRKAIFVHQMRIGQFGLRDPRKKGRSANDIWPIDLA